MIWEVVHADLEKAYNDGCFDCFEPTSFRFGLVAWLFYRTRC